MLEYIKMILLKVSFDKKLFEKELRKAFKVLIPEELKQLKQWCYEKFSEMYLFVLNKVFSRAQVSEPGLCSTKRILRCRPL